MTIFTSIVYETKQLSTSFAGQKTKHERTWRPKPHNHRYREKEMVGEVNKAPIIMKSDNVIKGRNSKKTPVWYEVNIFLSLHLLSPTLTAQYKLMTGHGMGQGAHHQQRCGRKKKLRVVMFIKKA